MRTRLFGLSALLSLAACGTAVSPDGGRSDGGILRCGAGETALCGCSNGFVGVQRCVEGLYAPCSCETRCVPGRSESCTCSDGATGARYCDSTGSFGMCECARADAGTDASVGRDAGRDACVPRTCTPGMCGTADDGCGTPIDCGACASGVQMLDVQANHIVFDATRNRIYATVGQSASRFPNSVVAVDPATGDVVWNLSVGSDPKPIALSDDASTLWIGLDGANAVRSIDVGAMTLGAVYPLPRGVFGDYGVAGDIVVLPGSRTTIAVNIHDYGLSPSLQGTAVLDDGAARPTQAPGHTGASSLTGGPTGYLFGFNYAHTGFEFFTLTVSPSGLTQMGHSGLASGFATHVYYAAPYVFATDGAVIDVSTPTTPHLAGHLPMPGTVAPDVAGGVAYVLAADSFSSSPATIYRYGLSTFAPTGSAPLGMFGSRSMRDLTKTGTDRFAVVGAANASQGTNNNQLYLLTPTFH